MKKLLIACLVFLSCSANAQDRITLLTKEEIKAKVLEITPELIRYNLEGTESPMYSISKTSVFSIRYADGRIDSFLVSTPPSVQPVYDTIYYTRSRATLLRKTPCQWGEFDAKHYHLSGAKNFTVGFLGGFIGVIAVAVIPPSAPSAEVSAVPEITADPAYVSCYRDKAKSKNVASAVGGWLTATGLLVMLIAAGL